jgi:hypothetical protein
MGKLGVEERSVSDHEVHDCQLPPAESIGQIWICPICGDSWRAEEGAPIGGEAYAWVRGAIAEE